jgi:hypothetical protein
MPGLNKFIDKLTSKAAIRSLNREIFINYINKERFSLLYKIKKLI